MQTQPEASLSGQLPAAVSALLEEKHPDRALTALQALAQQLPEDWEPDLWLTLAAAARPEENPRWLAVSAFAFEQAETLTAPVDALLCRARLMLALGANEKLPYQSLKGFIAQAKRLIGDDLPEPALQSYREARRTVQNEDSGSQAWLAARNRFLRCRRLRELARVLDMLQAFDLPDELRAWTAWAGLKEESLDTAES